MGSIRRATAAAVLATVMAVPAAGVDEGSERTKPPTLEGSTLTWCGDVQQVEPDPALWRDTPVYVGNEQPTGKVLKWARKKPGFAELWIDRDHFGWLVVAFSEDVDRRQAEIERRFPDDGVVAVEVEHTKKELRRLQRRIGDRLPEVVDSFGVGVDVSSNTTQVDVPYLTEEIVAWLEAEFGDEPFCIDGRDPSERPVAGPQPTGGEGWSLVGYKQGRGQSYRTGVASEPKELERLWERSKVKGPVPDVDFGSQVVLWFAIGHGSSCPNFRMDDVVIDAEAAVVHPLIVSLDDSLACTDDLAGTYQFVVAVDRDRLPAGPFTVQLGPAHGYGASPDQTVIEADLSEPGTAAGRGEVHRALRLHDDPVMRSGTIIEPFGEWDYLFDASCGIGYLGLINDIHWVADETEVPEAWTASIDAGGEVVVRIAIRSEPEAHVDATLAGHTVRYLPAAQAPPDCAD